MKEDWKDVGEMLHFQGLLYIFEIIYTKLPSRYHDNLLTSHLEMKKTRELIAQKYYLPTLRYDIKAYVKSCDVYLTSKTVKHEPYKDL